jgi:hypothetical protein
MAENKHDLILKQWVASLKFRKRDRTNVAPNFEDLFEQLKRAGATFDEAYEMLPAAIKAHLPVPSLVKQMYAKLKRMPNFDKTEKEYVEEWNKSIEDTATNSFFVWFPIKKDDDDDDEPKVFGNMSVKEYRTQRSYADSFTVLDTTELEQRMHNRQYNLDIEDLIKNILGDKDETNS